MTSSMSNIKTVARDIFSKQLSLGGGRGAKLAANIDRYWHCIADELEAGLVDDAGETVPERGFDEGLAAYRDWCRRHPESKPVSPRPKCGKSQSLGLSW